MCYISSKSGLNPLRGCTMFDSLHVKIGKDRKIGKWLFLKAMHFFI